MMIYMGWFEKLKLSKDGLSPFLIVVLSRISLRVIII